MSIFIIIVPLISTISADNDDTAVLYKQELLGECIGDYICKIIKFNYNISDVLVCGQHCNEDSLCLFFQSRSPKQECFLCTNDITGHKEVTQISKMSYSEGNRNNIIFQAVERKEIFNQIGKSPFLIYKLIFIKYNTNWADKCKKTYWHAGSNSVLNSLLVSCTRLYY